jgi:hypothetical protein
VDGLHARLLGRRKKKGDVAFGKAAAAVGADQSLDIISDELNVSRADLFWGMRGLLARPIAARRLCRCAGSA